MNGADKALRAGLDDEFNRDPNWYIILGEKLLLFRDGAWPKGLIDCVFQYDWHHNPDIYDIWAFLDIYTSLNGRIAVFKIPTNCEPFPDKEHTSNNEALAMLPSPFEGKFWGGNQGADGQIFWTRPIHATLRVDSEIRWLLIPSFNASLEVGYNSSGKFLEAINRSGAIARWPYGQHQITVFINLDLLPCYHADNKGFEKVLTESGETINDCIESADRDPWPAWNIGYEDPSISDRKK